MGDQLDEWRLQTSERLASIESSIKYIEANIQRLPPSPECVSVHKNLDERVGELEDFKKYITIRIAWVSGAFAALASGLLSVFDSLRDSIFKVH